MIARSPQVTRIALAALWRDRFQVVCHIAMIVGIVVPLLTVLGAKNGAIADLLHRLTADPALLTIETQGNDSVSAEQIALVRDLPGVIFVVPQSRSQINWVRVRYDGAPLIQNARLYSTAPGDPLLAGFAEPDQTEVAVSADLAERLALEVGAQVEIVTDAPGRTRQGRSSRIVSAILPQGRIAGEQILIDPDFLESLEAFSDGYAVPALGIVVGIDLATRSPSFEGLRVNVGQMADVGPVRQQVEQILRRNTRSAATAIDSTLRIVTDLEAAFRLIALIGFIGVAAALVGTQINDVRRQRRVLATLNLLGYDRRDLLLMPAVQSLFTVGLGLLISLAAFLPAARLAERILNPGDVDTQAFVTLLPHDLAGVLFAGITVALVASLLAGRQIMAIDPALILRDAT